MGQYAALLRRYRPRFLKGIASALYFFAVFFKQQGIADVTVRGIFSTGEMLLPAQRRLIEEVFGGKVHDSYGHMERTVAIRSAPRGGLHINPEYGILELVDREPLALERRPRRHPPVPREGCRDVAAQPRDAAAAL